MNRSQTVESITQSVCAQCGSRLTLSEDGETFCINCLLRASLGEEGFDRAETSHRFDQDESIARDHGRAVEFGDYELLEEIGRGSQGLVYRARQKSLNRTVALKIIAFGHWASQAHVKRFRREAEAAASLEHPCIVPIYEVGERDGACYFSMKFVEGGQLDEVVKREPMPPRRAAKLIVKLAHTVHYAHERHILHRDIKPGNILLDAKGEPHLTDFGLARLVESESTVTRTLEVLGTPSYMAPEQAAGKNIELTAAIDIYGLGAVLYHLLTGHPPFAGGTTHETVRLALETNPRRPRLLNSKIDRELETICLRCLDRDPKRRYSSALELAEDLERWLKHEPIQARRTGVFIRGSKWVRRKPAIAGVIILSLALAAAVGWNFWKSELIRRPATKGIAVLPLENLSPDPDNAYFADGMQEEILTRLASIADLKVISRTSTQRYQSKPRNLSQIAKQLGVANILEGSVQKVADQVRVNVQLINAQTDSHLWAETYDRKVTDIFGVESDIAKGIAESLQAKLSGREEQALAVKPIKNPHAYDAYLRGLAFQTRSSWHSDDALRNAIDSYEKAVQLDPSFAPAWARLARAHAWKYERHEGTVLRRDAATKALDNAQKLQPDSPETLLALGYYQRFVLGDWEAAKTTFRRVGEMLPSSSEVPMALGRIARNEGQWNDSNSYFERALSMDPRNVELLAHAAWNYTMLRQFPTALKLYDGALDIVPHDSELLASKAGIYQAQGNLKDAAKLLPEINEQTTSNEAFKVKITQMRLERRFDEAVHLLQTRLAQFRFFSAVEKSEYQAMLSFHLYLAGDRSSANFIAKQARDEIESQLEGSLDWDNLALANAVMGNKDLAIKAAEHAGTLVPTVKDRVNGPSREEWLALIQTIFGENGRAISILTRLVQTPYLSWLYVRPVTPALLRLDPIWDPLRGDLAFQKLCEEKQP
jgi:serine/threonine protein kinase/Tfp pilus assembly protein PilF